MAGIVPIGRLAFLLALALLALLAAGPLAAQQTRSVTVEPRPSPAAQLKLGDAYALVIGNNQYKHLPVLQTAVSDAAAVAELLRGKYEFADVRLLLNATRADILGALNRYRRDLEPEDRLLIYYAGHGDLDRGAERGYWLPVEAEPDNDIDWISNARITDLMKAMLARHVMVVADSCYSGTLTRGEDADAKPPPGTDRMAWVTRVAAKRARTVLTSGGLEPVVDGGRNGHSVFATAFLDVLRENEGLLDGQSLFDRLKGRVVVNAAQTPAYGNVRYAYHEGGDFIFAPRQALAVLASQPAPPVPAKPSPATSPCLLVWQGIAGSRQAADFELFLSSYPDCPMAPFARARLEALQAETKVAARTPPDEPGFAVEERDETLVALKNANVRGTPVTGGKKLTTLRRGTKVAVTGRVKDRDWLRIALADGGTGYIWAPLLGDGLPQPEPEKKPDTKVAVGTYPQRQGSSGPQVGSSFRDCAECPEMVVLPAGSFMMGSPASDQQGFSKERPQHRVTIPAPFAVGKYEVTWAEWEACVAAGGCDASGPRRAGGDNGWGRGRRPAINVNWEDAKAYVAWLSRRTGHSYGLLSEAEWEYAARAGTMTPFHTGSTITPDQANFDGSRGYNGSAKGMDREMTVPTGSFAANAFGLHDMHGNVWEWTEDCWHDNYSGAPSDGNAWTTGGCDKRVLRSGSWDNHPRDLRSAYRAWNTPDVRVDVHGFRVSRTLSP